MKKGYVYYIFFYLQRSAVRYDGKIQRYDTGGRLV